jgi:hypothetical protein
MILFDSDKLVVKALLNIHILISDSTLHEKGRSKKEFSPYLLTIIRGCKSSFSSHGLHSS